VKERRRHYHHGALAAALLAEAVAVARERGVERVSLRALAQRIGVSASAAYQHFPDKAALLVAVGEWAFDELARRMQVATAAVTAEGDAGAVARLGAIGRAYVGFAAEEPHLFRHMFGALMAQDGPREPGACIPSSQVVGEVTAHGMLLLCLTDLEQRGLLRPGVGVGSGLDLLTWSMVQGFSVLVVEGHVSFETNQELFREYVRLVLRDEVLARLDPGLLDAPPG
jgi:AcrR family transcriptional regulator